MATFTDLLQGVIYSPWSNNYDMYYDDFFHPNVCHVCKKTNNGDLKICDRCYMVSYCSDLHILVDYLQHQQFCNSIKKYVIDKNGRDWRSIRLSTFEWIQSRYEFLREITMQFSYNLAPYEIQMITFAKSCYMCHQQNYLHPCQTCYSEYYCVEHVKNFSDFHSLKCQALKLYLNSNILNRDFQVYGYTVYTYREPYIEFPDDKRPVENMENFIMKYIRSYYHRNIRAWTSDEYVYSDYVSRPLTLYDGMKKAGLLDTLNVEECIVHIMSEGFVERQYVYAWEILLHLLHRIKSLKIVLIGKRLHTEGFRLPACKNCIKHHQMCYFESYSMFYNEYASSPSFRPPNVMVVFQAHFNIFHWVWKNILLASQRIRCPYFLTAGSRTIAEVNIQKIRQVMNVEPKYNALNNFKSYMPCRLLSPNYIGYPNSHVIIYDNLNSQKSETVTSSPWTS